MPRAVATRQSENHASIPDELGPAVGPAGAEVPVVDAGAGEALLDDGEVPRAALILASSVDIKEPKEADTAVCTDWLTSS